MYFEFLRGLFSRFLKAPYSLTLPLKHAFPSLSLLGSESRWKIFSLPQNLKQLPMNESTSKSKNNSTIHPQQPIDLSSPAFLHFSLTSCQNPDSRDMAYPFLRSRCIATRVKPARASKTADGSGAGTRFASSSKMLLGFAAVSWRENCAMMFQPDVCNRA